MVKKWLEGCAVCGQALPACQVLPLCLKIFMVAYARLRRGLKQ